MQSSYEILFIQIEKKREEMILLGNQHGLTSPETIHASRQLDHLLNQLSYLEKPSLGVTTKLALCKLRIKYSPTCS